MSNRSFLKLVLLVCAVVMSVRTQSVLAQPAAGGAAKKTYTIGYSQCNSGEPWRAQMDADIKAAAKEHGEIKLGGRSGQVAADDDWLVEGTVKSVNGAGKVFGIPGMRTARGTNVALELEAKSGKVRAYLESSVPDASKFLGRRLGYVYAEASPGKPGRAVGMLTRLTGSQFGKDRPFQFIIESVDGEATEISYKLYRNKK